MSGQTDLSLRMDLICLDPSAFASTPRLKAVAALTGESAGTPAYVLAVDDGFYNALEAAIPSADHPQRDTGALKRILTQWGENTPIFDAEYEESLKTLLQKLQPLQNLLERIDKDQRRALLAIDEILGKGSPDSERIAKGLVRTAGVLRARVLSLSQNAEKHLARLRRVVVTRAKGSRAWSRRIKFDIKDRLTAGGWRGRVFVYVVGSVLGAAVGLATQNPLLGLASSFILMIVTNGSQLPCPHCDRKLSSPNWGFCPWCGHGLTGYS